MRSACPPIMHSCKYLNFSRGNSDMDLLARRTIQELEGDEGQKHLDEYADASTQRGQCMLKTICEKFGFTPSLAVVTGSPPVGDWTKADVIRETMRRLELTEARKPEILMVGDRKFDVLGAKACGIACAGVEFFGYAAPGELAEAGAAAEVRTPEELEQFILTH